MTAQKSPSKGGGIKLEPLKGQFFDIKPSKSGKRGGMVNDHGNFLRFVVVAFLAFLCLGFANTFIVGRELVFDSQEAAYQGYESIQQGVQSLLAQQPEEALSHFNQADAAFEELRETTAPITSRKNFLRAETLYLETADKLIESAQEVVQIGQELAGLMQGVSELPQAFLSMAGGGGRGLIEALDERKESFDKVVSMAASLQRKMTTLNEGVLPEDLREKIQSARHQLGQWMATLLEVDRNYEILLTLLGDRVPHRYLLLLQNNHELRATGGFIGSYVIVDVNDGVISRIEAKDVYETDGQLSEFVEPPPGIDRVADRLYMRDANYSPDFPTSARKIMWFLEHSKGPSVDTVVAIDQTVVESLLQLTGPLVLSGFPFQIRAENFNDLISFHTEAKLSDSVTPKQLLFDLIPAIQGKLAGLRESSKLIALASNLMASGHLQVYSTDPNFQSLITQLGADGAMIKPEAETDYLALVTTSIGGNKSDQYMQTDLQHRTVVSENGVLEDKLTLKKTHTWNQEAESKMANLIERYGTGKLSEEALYYILGRGPNRDYMRVYVPRGSQLQSASGIELSAIEVSEDLGYTVFAFVCGPVEAGGSQEISLRYRLPYQLSFEPDDSYRFIARHQAGAENLNLKKELITAQTLVVSESYPPSKEAFTLSPSLDVDFDRHQFFISSIRQP